MNHTRVSDIKTTNHDKLLGSFEVVLELSHEALCESLEHGSRTT